MSARQKRRITGNLSASKKRTIKFPVSINIQDFSDGPVNIPIRIILRKKYIAPLIPMTKKRYSGILLLPLLTTGIIVASCIGVIWMFIQGKSEQKIATSTAFTSSSKPLIPLPKEMITPSVVSKQPTELVNNNSVSPSVPLITASPSLVPVLAKTNTTVASITPAKTASLVMYQPTNITTITENVVPTYASGSITSTVSSTQDTCPNSVTIFASISVTAPTIVTWSLMDNSIEIMSGSQHVSSLLPISQTISSQNGLHVYTLTISTPNSSSISSSRYIDCVIPAIH